MKAEIELSVDRFGKPCIKLIHHERNNSLDQKLLGAFIKIALTNGCEITEVNGSLNVGTDHSIVNYEIRIKD